jgi:hypothetical protein
LIWLRIRASEGCLWTRYGTLGFHKMLGSSSVTAQLAASQEGLSSMNEWLTMSLSNPHGSSNHNLHSSLHTIRVMKWAVYIAPMIHKFIQNCSWNTDSEETYW